MSAYWKAGGSGGHLISRPPSGTFICNPSITTSVPFPPSTDHWQPDSKYVTESPVRWTARTPSVFLISTQYVCWLTHMRWSFAFFITLSPTPTHAMLCTSSLLSAFPSSILPISQFTIPVGLRFYFFFFSFFFALRPSDVPLPYGTSSSLSYYAKPGTMTLRANFLTRFCYSSPINYIQLLLLLIGRFQLEWLGLSEIEEQVLGHMQISHKFNDSFVRSSSKNVKKYPKAKVAKL